MSRWRRFYNLHLVRYKDWGRTLITLFIAGLIVFLLNAFVLGSYQTKGVSMEPTLDSGDRLLIFKGGKSWANLLGNNYEPKRGEIIVFEQGSERLIKRVIGLPGERIVINDGQIVIYNQQYPLGFSPDFGQLPAISPYERVNRSMSHSEFFVIGDNRSPGASHDSRSTLGNIHSDQIVGRLIVRLWPLDFF